MTDCLPLKRSSTVASVVTTAWPLVTTCSITVLEPRNRRAPSGSACPPDMGTDIAPVTGSTSTMKPRAAFISVIMRSITLLSTTSSSRDELRSRASS